MKAISILRLVPFILIGIILLIKIFFPTLSISSTKYLLVVSSFAIISLIAISLLVHENKIKRKSVLLLLLGILLTIALLIFQYINI